MSFYDEYYNKTNVVYIIVYLTKQVWVNIIALNCISTIFIRYLSHDLLISATSFPIIQIIFFFILNMHSFVCWSLFSSTSYIRVSYRIGYQRGCTARVHWLIFDLEFFTDDAQPKIIDTLIYFITIFSTDYIMVKFMFIYKYFYFLNIGIWYWFRDGRRKIWFISQEHDINWFITIIICLWYPKIFDIF
jgi:hypothetical protein